MSANRKILIFEWNNLKANLNSIKHSVGFEDVFSVFTDSNNVEILDEKHSDKEIRNKLLGKSHKNEIFSIVFTRRVGVTGIQKLRIISARKANKKEKRLYYENQKKEL
jgi:uncharacterized DUF497 family protein